MDGNAPAMDGSVPPPWEVRIGRCVEIMRCPPTHVTPRSLGLLRYFATKELPQPHDDSALGFSVTSKDDLMSSSV